MDKAVALTLGISQSMRWCFLNVQGWGWSRVGYIAVLAEDVTQVC